MVSILSALWGIRIRGLWKLQSILKEVSTEYSLEGLILKLKLQYCGHLMQRTDLLEKKTNPWCWERLKAGERGDRGWDDWMASPTGWTWIWASSGSWWWTGNPGVLLSMGSQRAGHDWVTALHWTEQKVMTEMRIVVNSPRCLLEHSYPFLCRPDG